MVQKTGYVDFSNKPNIPKMPVDKKINEYGFRFKDDRLMVFTPKEILILHRWPDLSCVEKMLPDGYWVPKDLPFRILASASSNGPDNQRTVGENCLTPIQKSKQQAYAAFSSTIPPEAIECLEKFRCRQLQPLRLFAADPKRALELFESTPNLGFIMANAHRLRSRLTHEEALSQAKHRIHLPQRKIIELMGMPGTRQAVKLLRKIPQASMSDRVIRAIPHLLKEKSRMDQLSHLPVITPPVMELLISKLCSARVKPAFLEEVVAGEFQTGEQSPADKVKHLVDLLEFLGEDTTFEIASLKQLNRLIEEAEEKSEERRRLLAELAAQEEEPRRQRTEQIERDFQEGLEIQRKEFERQMKEFVFPPPPVLGTDSIHPLTSLKQLNQEGEKCHNCVNERQALRLIRERCYYYKVLSPERATLKIRKDTNDNWSIMELRAPLNKAVKPETKQAVLQWLDSSNRGLG